MISSISIEAKVERLPADTQRKDRGTTIASQAEKKRGKDAGSEVFRSEGRTDIDEAVEKIISTARFLNREIHLEIDRELDIMIVKVIDGETEKVIRQIPPEELVELSKNARDLKGLLIDKEG
ncbi:MAG: flagellar protein FlaG [Nitrospiraceae bacterium]|nr:MAG: flagellar protein FlaG [Nitrospiraceae bacterium]